MLPELPCTDKVLFKRPLSTRVWLKSRNPLVAKFYLAHELIDILPDKYLEDHSTSCSKKNIRELEDLYIELDGSVLINSRDPSSIRSDIRGDEVKLFDSL